MVERKQPEIAEMLIPIRYSGSWPPDASQLAGVGFDSISVSGSGLEITKVHGADLAGKPHAFTNISICKNTARLRHSHHVSSDAGVCRMRAVLLFLRVLRLLPGISADAQKLSEMLLPSLEEAGQVSSEPYDVLRKKCSDLSSLLEEERSRNRRLSSSSEETARSCLKLEQRLEAAQERLRSLESVPDSALCELVADWVSSHHGSFNCADFSKATGLHPARCEAGLEMLLKKGALREIGAHYVPGSTVQERQFERRGQQVRLDAKSIARSISSSARRLIPAKHE